jgi:hypothetical protein
MTDSTLVIEHTTPLRGGGIYWRLIRRDHRLGTRHTLSPWQADNTKRLPALVTEYGADTTEETQ